MKDNLRRLPEIHVRILKGLHKGKSGTLIGWQTTRDDPQRCWLRIEGEPVTWNFPRNILAVIQHTASDSEAA